MSSTSVHLPPLLLERLDRLAVERGSSRNRLIVEACEALLLANRGTWPAGFFESRLSSDDLELLQQTGMEMEAAIYGARKNKRAPKL